MQSRRHEDYETRRKAAIGRDSYLMMSPPHSKRSWIPRRVEGPGYGERVERVMSGRRSVSLERRRGRSRSPLFIEATRGRHVCSDEFVSDRELRSPERRSRYEFIDHVDRKGDGYTRNEFGYGRGLSSTGVMDDNDRVEGRRLDSGMREIGSQKASVMGMDRLSGDVGPASIAERGVDVPLPNVGLGQIGKERVQYPEVRESYLYDKYAAMKQYGDREETIDMKQYADLEEMTVMKQYGDREEIIGRKQYGDHEETMANLRDTPYSNLTASRSKEFVCASHFEDYAMLSPRKSRVDHLGYQGGIPLPRDNHPLNSMHLPELLSHSRYEQRQRLDHGRDTDLDINEDMARYQRERVSPPRSGHLVSLHRQPRTRESEGCLYPSDEMYEKINLRERVDYHNRDILKPHVMETVIRRAETSDYARVNMGHRSSLDHIPLEKLTASRNIGLSRSPVEKRESGQYLDAGSSIHSRLGRKISNEQERPYMGMPHDHEIERLRVDYDCKRDVGSGSQKERMRSPPRFLYDTERLGLSERGHKMERHDLSPYDSSSRFLKRKYTLEYEEDRIMSRTMMSKPDTISRRHDRDYREEEWIDQDGRVSDYSTRRDHTHGLSRRVDYVYDDDEYSYHDHHEFIHDHDHDYDHDHRMKSYKNKDKYARDYPRSSGHGVGSDSYHPNKRNVLPKYKNVPITSENDEDDMYSGEIQQYEPHKDTEFKQLVHEYFLSFTKKLNHHPGVRRRYMEQGRAGSLFCIVCGRSLSKEFLDTQRLAMHAFMSHKGGLRAQHLGLLKAICVMLGWNSAIPAETLRWFPENLSTAESIVQRQDLIIWPPVIIVHNTSITNDSDGQGPTSPEALGQFLRGKGLSGRKVKLGKYANCSIMLVKFLGTFSALQEAEKMHKYFLKNKHGRKELDQITSSKGKSNNSEEGEINNGDKEAERVLFGYMGIAEDLDKVDFDTKRKCSIKSKKEIQDLADAPVKPK